MSLAASPLTKLFTPVTKVAKTIGSMALFCLRLQLYVLACIPLVIISTGVYFLTELYFDYQDLASDSPEFTSSATHFQPNWLSPSAVSDEHCASLLKETATTLLEPTSVSIADLDDPENVTRERFANFGLRPESQPLTQHITPSTNSPLALLATSTAAQRALPHNSNTTTTTNNNTATTIAATNVVTTTSTVSTTPTARSHIPFNILSASQQAQPLSYSGQASSFSSIATRDSSVAEIMAANTQTIDSCVNAILARGKLEQQIQILEQVTSVALNARYADNSAHTATQNAANTALPKATTTTIADENNENNALPPLEPKPMTVHTLEATANVTTTTTTTEQ